MTADNAIRARQLRRPGLYLALAIVLAGANCQTLAAKPAVECGALVTADVKLQADLGPCPGDGLTVAASGITVNLNGYRIIGTRRLGTGVRLQNVDNVVVKSGTVEGFDSGVLLVGGHGNQVTRIRAQNNRFGIRVEDAESGGHRIEKNVATDNRLIGIFFSRSVSGALIGNNEASGNVGYGIVLGANSWFNVVERNIARNNGVRDIELREGEMSFSFPNVVPPIFKPVVPDRAAYVEGVDYHVGSAVAFRVDTRARLVPIGIGLDPAATAADNPSPADTSTSGCRATDYAAAGFRPGDIALVQRGTCEIAVKADLALKAGAAAILIFNEGQSPVRTTHDFGVFGAGPAASLPVLFTSYGVGFELLASARQGQVDVWLQAQTDWVAEPDLEASFGNLVVRNSAGSAADENSFCGTNRWSGNVFGTWNRPCVNGDLSGDGGLGGTGSRARIY